MKKVWKILVVTRYVSFAQRLYPCEGAFLSAGTFHDPIETARAPAVNYRPIRRPRLSIEEQIKRLSILTACTIKQPDVTSFVRFVSRRAYVLTCRLFLLSQSVILPTKRINTLHRDSRAQISTTYIARECQ